MATNKKQDQNQSETVALTVDPAIEAERQAALALVTKAIATWVGSIGTEAVAVEECALATFAASPFIGKGNGETGGWETAEAYAEQFPNRNGQGVISKQTVTRWRRMGQAHGLGITPAKDAKRWQRLNVSAALDTRVGKALADPKVSLTKVRKAIDGCYVDGKYLSESAAKKQQQTGPGEESNPTPPAPKVPESVSAMLDTLEAIAARLAGTSVTPAEATRLAEILVTLDTVTAGNVDTVEAERKAG